MNAIKHLSPPRSTTRKRAAVALATAAFAVASGAAFAQQPVPKDSDAPMVKQPNAASGAGQPDNPANPDHMPVKRPRTPTNDKMMRNPPASAANAK